MRKNSFFGTLTLLVLILPIYLTFFANKNQVKATIVKNLKDVVSSSQFSYYGGLGVGNSAGDTIIKIDTGTSYPSRTSNNLFVGDTLTIGIGGSQAQYTVRDIGNTTQIVLSTGISFPTNLGSIIATRSAIHTISFEPQVPAVGGYWQFLIKATSVGGSALIDKIPDQDGFDAGALTAAAITCPWTGSASIGTTTTITNFLGTNTYYIVKCTDPNVHTIGAGNTGVITIGVGNSMLINPSTSHIASNEGTSDPFSYILEHYDTIDNGGGLMDRSYGKIAMVESVRVTATVDPTLTFTIAGLGNGTWCGMVNTQQGSVTATQVPFGSLALASTTNNLAQKLSVLTNSSYGYVVTTSSPRPMTMASDTSVTIANTNCNSGTCTAGVGSSWTTSDATQSEFGYSLETDTGSPTMAFNATSFSIAKPFTTVPTTIFSYNNYTATTQSARVCYRITTITSQKSGDYEAQINYTATAIF